MWTGATALLLLAEGKLTDSASSADALLCPVYAIVLSLAGEGVVRRRLGIAFPESPGEALLLIAAFSVVGLFSSHSIMRMFYDAYDEAQRTPEQIRFASQWLLVATLATHSATVCLSVWFPLSRKPGAAWSTFFAACSLAGVWQVVLLLGVRSYIYQTTCGWGTSVAMDAVVSAVLFGTLATGVLNDKSLGAPRNWRHWTGVVAWASMKISSMLSLAWWYFSLE